MRMIAVGGMWCGHRWCISALELEVVMTSADGEYYLCGAYEYAEMVKEGNERVYES